MTTQFIFRGETVALGAVGNMLVAKASLLGIARLRWSLRPGQAKRHIFVTELLLSLE